MTALRTAPLQLRWTLLLGLLGLALTVPSSSPDGTGMQWDDPGRLRPGHPLRRHRRPHRLTGLCVQPRRSGTLGLIRERQVLVTERQAGTAIRRPGSLRWLWYALGGGLPKRFSPWVLHDTTTRTWVLRHMARAFAQLAVPIGLVLLLVPGEFWIRGMAALGGVFLGLFFSVAYMPEATEHRVKQAGYPVGTATALRDEAARLRQIEESDRRRAAAARRAARYRERQGR